MIAVYFICHVIKERVIYFFKSSRTVSDCRWGLSKFGGGDTSQFLRLLQEESILDKVCTQWWQLKQHDVMQYSRASVNTHPQLYPSSFFPALGNWTKWLRRGPGISVLSLLFTLYPTIHVIHAVHSEGQLANKEKQHRWNVPPLWASVYSF